MPRSAPSRTPPGRSTCIPPEATSQTDTVASTSPAARLLRRVRLRRTACGHADQQSEVCLRSVCRRPDLNLSRCCRWWPGPSHRAPWPLCRYSPRFPGASRIVASGVSEVFSGEIPGAESREQKASSLGINSENFTRFDPPPRSLRSLTRRRLTAQVLRRAMIITSSPT